MFIFSHKHTQYQPSTFKSTKFSILFSKMGFGKTSTILMMIVVILVAILFHNGVEATKGLKEDFASATGNHPQTYEKATYKYNMEGQGPRTGPSPGGSGH